MPLFLGLKTSCKARGESLITNFLRELKELGEELKELGEELKELGEELKELGEDWRTFTYPRSCSRKGVGHSFVSTDFQITFKHVMEESVRVTKKASKSIQWCG